MNYRQMREDEIYCGKQFYFQFENEVAGPVVVSGYEFLNRKVRAEDGRWDEIPTIDVYYYYPEESQQFEELDEDGEQWKESCGAPSYVEFDSSFVVADEE